MLQFIVPLLTTLTGAALQQRAVRQAQERQQAQIRDSLERQRQMQLQAEQRALGAARTFAPEQRQEAQAQLAEELTQTLLAPVSEAQAIRAQQSATQGDVSGDYQAAKARSELEAARAAQELARLLGQRSSAARLRLNEGLALMDVGQDIERLGNFAQGQQRADRLGIELAGQPDGRLQFVGGALQGLGTAGLGMAGGSLNAAGAGLKYGTSGQQAAQLAAQEAGMGTGGLWNAGGQAVQAAPWLRAFLRPGSR